MCLLGCVLLVGCGARADSAPDPEAVLGAFPVATPAVKDVSVERSYVAEIHAVRHAELRSRLRGILESVSVDEGQAVKAGQTLFTINARARKQDLELAKAASLGAAAELKSAELDLANTQVLADKDIVSSAELARARSKVDMVRAKLAQTRAAQARSGVELDYACIRAPFDGVVHRVPRKAGSAIAEDELLTTISDTREVFAYFSISEREYLSYLRSAQGTRPRTVSLELADGSAFDHVGEIDATDSEIDSQTGTLTYRARFPNPDGVLKHGSTAKVVLATQLHDALVIPQKATFEIQGDTYVYAVDSHNIVHARKITVRARLADSFAIESGLTKADRIVLEGVQKLREGLEIEVQPPASTK
jgi:membrane fusion protein (multidrug efflux system)